MTGTFRLWSVNKGFTTQLDKSKTLLIDCADKPYHREGTGDTLDVNRELTHGHGEGQPWLRLTRRKPPLTAWDRKTVSDFPFEIL